MKKILLVLHGDRFPETAFDFIGSLNEMAPLHLTALIIPEIAHIENWAAYSSASAGNLIDTTAQTNTDALVRRCSEHRITFSIRQGSTMPGLPQIISETRFADLLVTSYGGFYVEEGESIHQTLRQVMHESECPVMAIPEGARLPEQLFFAYDGSESCMFAIKQFTYLFPEFRSLPAVLVHIDKDGVNIPGRENVEEWINGYYSKAALVTINYDAAQYFSNETNAKQTLIVSGSFGRTAISQWVHPSFADELISKYRPLLFSGNRG